MATITAFTAARSLEIEQSSVTTGAVDVNGDLILTTRGGTNINAGHVVGPAGTPVNTLEQDVKNTTGFTLNKGTAVYISGSTGSNVLVSKAQANSEATSSKTLGLISENILNGTTGQVTTEGVVSGIDTSTAIAGDSVWLSPTVPGGLTYGLANKPTAPNHLVYLGVVVRSHAVNGEIYVKVQNGYELDELHDVSITSAEKGDTLVHDGIKWINSKTIPQNFIINGGFDIWQRGPGPFTSSVGTFSADRWVTDQTISAGTRTISQQTFTPGTAPVSGYEGKYFIRLATSSNFVAGYHNLQTRIEDVRTLAGQLVTVSFWAKADSARTITANYHQGFDPGYVFGLVGTASLTTSWQRFSYTFTMPSVSGKTINSNSFTGIFFNFPPAASATYDIWGVQLERGATATHFRRNGSSIQAELAACQRYYWRENLAGTYAIVGVGMVGNDTTNATVGVDFPVTMRTPPTSLEWSQLFLGDMRAYAHTVTSIGGSGTNVSASKATLGVVCSGGGLVQFRPTLLHAEGGASAYLAFSAEI